MSKEFGEIGSVLRLFETVKHLKLRQIFYQIWYRIRRRRIDTSLSLNPSPFSFDQAWIPIQKAWQPESNTFTFLNRSKQYPSSVVWEDGEMEKLWLYNLHYFDYLISTHSESYAIPIDELINDWIEKNKDRSGNAWEPYPTSLRIVNWIKYHLQYRSLNKAALDSLANQLNWLAGGLEFHILANHLFANAKALVFGGMFFDADEAKSWLDLGVQLISDELDEQVLQDGAHYEGSPMYHSIILEDVLDLLNLTMCIPGQISKADVHHWREKAIRMLAWQRRMMHPDGEIAFLNDAAFGIAPSIQSLEEYATRLDIKNSEIEKYIAINSTSADGKKSSGYFKLKRGSFSVIANAASIRPSYQPGHAHADTLSCEISFDEHRIFVNSGTSTYRKGSLRDKQRATAAHNTVELNGENSSDVWGGFRVARRAYVENVEISGNSVDRLTATHNGYRRLKGAPKHTRVWELSDDGLQVVDHVSPTNVPAVVSWLLHPSVKVINNNQLLLADGVMLAWSLEGGETRIMDSDWYPHFGVCLPSKKIIATSYSDSKSLQPTSFRFKLWIDGNQPVDTAFNNLKERY